MWSVNEGLSRNLWKPPETSRRGFRQVSGRFSKTRQNHWHFQLCKTCHSRSGITSDFGFLLETCRKPPRPVSGGFRTTLHWRTTRYISIFQISIWIKIFLFKILPLFYEIRKKTLHSHFCHKQNTHAFFDDLHKVKTKRRVII